jgi:FkbM family methyltransferase
MDEPRQYSIEVRYNPMALKRHIKKLLGGALGYFTYYGTRVFLPPDSLTFRQACEEGIYEHASVRLLTALVNPNSTYFDVGANIGLMSLPVLSECSTCKVVSFEPSPNTLACLKKTHAGSRYAQRWTVIGNGVGDATGTADFYLAKRGGTFDGLRPATKIGVTTTVEVQITTLDAVWKSLDKPAVSIIKIDVEGAEMAVLQGARECIAANHPHILIEWYASNLKPFGTSSGSILSFAAECGYQLFTVAEGIEVKDANMLRLQMLRDFSFLLAPISKSQ